MIAGLEEITAGDLFIGDTLVNDMEPKDRDIAMVFQNYALYPHMTVYDNMAFGLKNQHMPNDQIRERVLEAARILDIEDYLERKPKAMSGGQRQRVALGRAIVRNPKVFLLDEPLSNLDAKLRAQMRTEITKLHKKLQTTFIYVTHDQVEAMTMGTRIVVMKLGYVQQIDTPLNLYNKPGNKFVAGFIGTPQMNFFDVTLLRNGDKVKVSFIKNNEKVRNTDDVASEDIKPVEAVVNTDSENLESFELDYEVISKVHDDYLHGDKVVTFGIRPDHLKVVDHKTDLQAKVNVIEQLGNESIIYAQLNGQEASITGAGQIIIKIPAGVTYEPGSIINVEVESDKVHFFDKETEVTLINDVPDYAKFDAEIKGDKMDFLGSKVALPPYFDEKIGDLKKVSSEVPPSACIDDGKDYKLKVHKVEQFGDKKLVSVILGDRYLFLLTNKEVKEGDDFAFSLENQKLTVLNGEEVVLAPVSDKESLVGTFVKRTEKEHLYKINKTWMNEDEILDLAKNDLKANNIEVSLDEKVNELKSSAIKE
jgi:multiple sugar transport system ATP-binding protein